MVAPAAATPDASPNAHAPTVLDLVETYVPPPRPPRTLHETWDARAGNVPPDPVNPPTKVDAMVCDLVQRVEMEGARPGIAPTAITLDDLHAAIAVYMTTDWYDIAGFRAWTHMSYIRALDDAGRADLALATLAYLAEHGTHCPD